ncbi:uncharacterized protein [Cardiocondyla obscurior]|uniref:uncharacterized protein n=1 Tax=Cardiocondyla obscurior TaxID=286306 RepID=UPI00396565E6
MKAIISVMIIGQLLINGTYGIIGYDCGTTNLNITTVSLLEIEECDIPIIEPQVIDVPIQLLQLSKFESTNVIQCKIIISRTVFYCGMHSHVSIVNNAFAEYILDTSIDQCKTMHKTGTLIVNTNNIISGLKINQTTTRPIIFAGSVTTDGKCYGTQYSDPYGTWQNVVVQGIIKITLSSHRAVTNIETNQIHLNTGTACQYSEGECIDIEGKFSYWETIPHDHCKFNNYDVLYEGKARKMISKINEKMQTVYSLTTNDVTFALTQISEEYPCGHTLIKTEHPKLFIYETTKGELLTRKKSIAVENIDIFAYVNSKFVYVERHLRTQINYLYTDIIKQRCELERQVLKNTLSLATQAPDEFAYQMMKGPGYMATLSGEVVHITRCTPVEVIVQHTQECYQQLPVSRENKTYFMSPRTHILFETGTQVPCSRILPTMFYLHDGWYKITPNVEYSKTPETIKPMTKPTWHYNDPGFLAASGIYTTKDLENLRDHIMFPAEKSSILNTVARGVRGEQVLTQGISLSNLMDEKTLKKITENAWKKIWGTFLSVGNASAGIIGIYFCIRTMKLIIDTVIHGYALHTIYGWSLHLIGAFWDSVTNLLIHLAQRKNHEEEKKITRNQEDNKQEDIKEENNQIKNEQEDSEKLRLEQQLTARYTIEEERKPAERKIDNEQYNIYPRL